MTEHIAKQFDVELNELQTNMLEMGADVRRQLDAVGRVLLRLDEEEAREVEAADQRINMKERSSTPSSSSSSRTASPRRATCGSSSRASG